MWNQVVDKIKNQFPNIDWDKIFDGTYAVLRNGILHVYCGNKNSYKVLTNMCMLSTINLAYNQVSEKEKAQVTCIIDGSTIAQKVNNQIITKLPKNKEEMI